MILKSVRVPWLAGHIDFQRTEKLCRQAGSLLVILVKAVLIPGRVGAMIFKLH